jgi:hypothetical protein
MSSDSIPADERMTPAELRVVREYLGLPGEWLARVLGVQDRTWRRWEAGASPIPDGVRLRIEDMEGETAQLVHASVRHLMDIPDPCVVTYRTDADYRHAHPEVTWPASWHRALIARVAEQVPGLSITYTEK